jgi:hypothetical protein
MSELAKALNDALDHTTGPGTAHAELDGARAEVDVVDADRLGVKCSRIKVHRAAPLDVIDAAEELPDRVRALGETLVPVEVDPGLGGAILRSEPEDNEFYELGAHSSGDLELRRFKGGHGVDREPVDFTLTRKQLGRLVDELG